MARDLTKYVLDKFQDDKQFAVVVGMETPEIEDLWEGCDNIRNDLFIESLTAAGAARTEWIMGLKVKATDSLEVRRFRIAAKNNEQLPYSFNIIDQQLATLCGVDGYSFTVDYAAREITARVALTAKGMYDEIENLLLRIRPANMVIDLSLLYNQYSTISPFTHAHLSAYTHHQLRNEVVS
ncbi:Uncharacterised protein [Acetobacterium wieringae]|uniref:putative phage tail protein n=1 Tax=Acetobacterium wieringae TaxID=52694 RepID=UPI001D5B9738|nr:putative phage tail protein [Acetobacterium wieringae]VUZ28543.1 Uncharacterised protein [Acetobacterium wieringae]